jgi:CarD family transcriptional regulator
MLKPGAVILHPSHGRGVVKEIKEMRILGKPTTYYVFDFPSNELEKIMIPVDRVDEVGIRTPVDIDAVNQAMTYLSSEDYYTPSPRSNFHRIHKEYTDKIASGKILEIAQVYKALFVKAHERELGLKDKLLFEKTERILLGEIEAACEISTEESRSLLTQSLKNRLN